MGLRIYSNHSDARSTAESLPSFYTVVTRTIPSPNLEALVTPLIVNEHGRI